MNIRRSVVLCMVAAVAVPAASRCAYASEGWARVSGRVVGPDGPIGGARVFLESGLEGPLSATTTDETGAFVFDRVVPGLTGVFAIAPGMAIDGRGFQVAVDDNTARVEIRLATPGTLNGTVSDASGDPVKDARISRALILGSSGVGIPFSKLEAHGIEQPITDGRGNFTVSSLPDGAEVALKVAHPSYAQGVTGSLRIGAGVAEVRLEPGVLLTGTVLAHGGDIAVPNAILYFRSAAPPHDTVVTQSHGDGGYAVRLRPGEWLYEASGSNFRTPNRQVIRIDAKFPAQTMPLRVAGTAPLRGYVKDARSGLAIVNARIDLWSMGNPSATTRTGPTGAYELTATEGENVVMIALAPGYLLPPDPAVRLSVSAGTPVELPTFWVAPLPRYSLTVVGADEKPVAGAVVRVLSPTQIGWYQADGSGIVQLSFATLPAHGTVVGLAEHPAKAQAALFAISREHSDDAIVQLLPVATITGTVTNEKNAGIAGATVHARTKLEDVDEPVTLWQAIAGAGGAWNYPAAVPHVPIVCTASAFDAAGTLLADSPSAAILPATAAVDAGTLVVPGAMAEKAARGRKYEWHRSALLCGELPQNAGRLPALVVHADARQVDVFAESLSRVNEILGARALAVALVVDGDAACGEYSVPILRGVAPARATVYLTGADSIVVYEGFDLPPLTAINSVAPAPGL